MVAPVNADDVQYLAELVRVLQDVGPWAARISADENGAQPAPGSSLHGDDDRAHPYQLSHAAWHSLSHAVDHLGCLRTLAGDAKMIHMFAPFTLVRGALENACAAVWLLEPPLRADRLTRRLRLATDDIHNGEQAKALMGQQGPRTEAERHAGVAAIATMSGLDQAAAKRKASYSEIIRAVDKADKADQAGSKYEVTWKLCSAYAHGDFWATLGASQRTEMKDSGQPGIGTFRIEANLRLLAHVTADAVRVTEWGWRLYDQRSQSPYR